jgi:hypothetical protein
MPSIFKENDEGLTSVFVEVTAAQIAGLAPGAYFTAYVTSGRTSDVQIVSSLDTEIQVFLMNGNAINGSTTKHAWVKVAPSQTFSLQSTYAPQTYLPGRTHILVRATAAGPATGTLRFVFNGDL